jgi:hypothetical protein
MTRRRKVVVVVGQPSQTKVQEKRTKLISYIYSKK